jgi:hypothetical protein
MRLRPTLLALLLAGAAAVIAVVAVLADDDGGSQAPQEPRATLGDAPPGRKPLIFDLGGLINDPEARDQALDEVAALGADAVRVVITWQYVAPQTRPPGFDGADPLAEGYSFSGYDTIVRAVEERGLALLLTPSGPFPPWASASGRSNVSDPDPREFGRFVQAVAARYNGRFDPGDGPLPAADLWSIWNEPNLSIFLQPQLRGGRPYSPLLYRSLYLAAYDAIQRETPGASVLVGETAPTGSTDSVEPVTFARGVLCLEGDPGAGADCSRPLPAAGWAAHPYATGTAIAPFDVPPQPGFVTMAALSRLEDVLDEAAEAGTVDSRLPVYIPEFGVQSEPDPLLGVPLEQQAEYISIAERMAYADPRVLSFSQYLLVDDAPDLVPGQTYGGFESGLRSADGTAKPSLAAFRTPLAVRREGDRVEVWGLVRPARGATSVQIRAMDPGGPARELRSLRTDGAGIFSFDSEFVAGRRWQVVWRNQGGESLPGPWVRAYAYELPGSTGAAEPG